jgi:hypothetical protein
MKTETLYHIKGMVTGIFWDRLAPSEKKAIAFAYRHINPEPAVMIDSHRKSLEFSLAHSDGKVSDRFRQDQTTSEDLDIAAMVASHSTDTDLVLYRGVNDSVYEQMRRNAENIPDCDLFEKGFLATSLVKDHELRTKTRLRIFVPKSSHVVYMGNVNDEQFFYEVDVQHGARLKIISEDRKYLNCLLLGTAD